MADADSTPRRPASTSLRDRFLDALIGLFERGLGRSSWESAQRRGARLGRVGWHFARRDRRRTLEHLAIALPELPAAARLALGRATFAHYGMLLAEALWIARHDPAELLAHVRVEGWDEVERARATGRPILVVAGHCGNWELVHAALNARGLDMAAMARGLDEQRYQGRLLALRDRFATRTIVRGTPGAARALLGLLRGGGALGIVIDQDTKVDGVFVPFFGRLAWTPVGAAELAARFDAVVLPTFAERLADGSHLVRVEPAMTLPADPVAATAAMTARIEAHIRRVPDQWVWLHRRWRTRPPDETLQPLKKTREERTS
jgi:KDO2-lipid IV(A) lauroyltransferase